MSCNSCGCPNIKEATCIQLDSRIIADVINSIDKYVCNNSKSLLNTLYYGFRCDVESHDIITKILCYRDSLKRYYFRKIRGYKQCMSSEKISCIIEKVKDIIPKQALNNSGVIVDKSQEVKWISENPSCVSYDKWNKYSKIVCDNLNLSLSSEEQKCDFTLEFTKNLIPCDVLLAATAFKETRIKKLKLKLKSKDQSNLEWRLLLERVPSCSVDLETYRKLLSSGLSFDIIESVYKEGLALDLQKLEGGGNVNLVTKISKYPLEDLATNVAALENNGYSVHKTVQDFLHDYIK